MIEKKELLPEEKEFVIKVAGKIGETLNEPLKLISNILGVCGKEFIETLLAETEAVEADGGMMTTDGERRRTIGGVFFKLTKDKLSPEQRFAVFGVGNKYYERRKRDWQALDWAERIQVVESIKKKGKVQSMRVKLIGSPGDIQRQGDTIVTQMEHLGGGSSLPGGLPPMPEMPTIYTVYIADQQWQKVKSSLKSKNKWLAVDGLCALDPETNTIAVFATAVKIHKSKEDEPKGKPKASKNTKPDKKPARKSFAPNDFDAQDDSQPEIVAPRVEIDVPEAAPTDVKQKLAELQVAAQQYHNKIATIEAKPEGQRFGLEMTRKLLAHVEQQITTLTKEYEEPKA